MQDAVLRMQATSFANESAGSRYACLIPSNLKSVHCSWPSESAVFLGPQQLPHRQALGAFLRLVQLMRMIRRS